MIEVTTDPDTWGAFSVQIQGELGCSYRPGVTNTAQKDIQRSMQVFGAVPLEISWNLFTIPREATQRMLGTNGALSISGGPTEFDHNDPFTNGQVTVQDPGGRFTQEVWNVIRDWTNSGGIRIFYVSSFENATGARIQGNQIVVATTGGITLKAGDLFDPIIFIDQSQNLKVSKTDEGPFRLARTRNRSCPWA